MRLLLTNDDGIDAPGLRAVVEMLRVEHDLVLCAPTGERSAVGQAFTFKRSYRVSQREAGVYTVDGTPTDCVMFALEQLGPFGGVVSGINQGANLAWDVWYSGTVGAACEAARRGLPAIAASLDTVGQAAPYPFEPAAKMLARYVQEGLLGVCPPASVINVNFPHEAALTREAPRLAPPGSYVYNRNVIEATPVDGTSWKVRVVQPGRLDSPPLGTDGQMVREGPVLSVLRLVWPTLSPSAGSTLQAWMNRIGDGTGLAN